MHTTSTSSVSLHDSALSQPGVQSLLHRLARGGYPYLHLASTSLAGRALYSLTFTHEKRDERSIHVTGFGSLVPILEEAIAEAIRRHREEGVPLQSRDAEASGAG